MKKILLIGDSIRVGYDKQVRAALEGQAEVYFPEENCRFAEYVLREIHTWKSQFKLGNDLDLIHWNAGLWDTLRLSGDEPLTPPEYYGHFIRRVGLMMKKLFPNAIQIFATSTPIQEEKYNDAFRRLNSDIEKYNSIARAELEPLGVLIDDLYPVIAAMPKEWYSDVTHLYTPQGTELITNAVLDSIIPALGLNPVKYTSEFKSPDKIVGI